MGWKILYAGLSTIFLINCGFSSLDITELSSFQYSIDISSQPVLLDEGTEKEGIILSSKHGQKYQCQYESFSQFSQKVREEEENASKLSVTKLLQPMEENSCLILTTGWWTYEFCYKKHIKQFHISEQKIIGDVLYLGFYAEEFDWGVKHKKEVSELRHRYHSQQYVNGSLCDLTGSTRSAEVRFKCKEDSADSLVSVEEPSTCKYLLHVTTPHLCKHPSLRSVPEKTSLPVVCNPVLGDSDYRDYVEYQKRSTEEREKEEALQLANKKESSMSDEIEGDGFGFIEIGNTRVKFYVLNYDGTVADPEEKSNAESISDESTIPEKELSPSPDLSAEPSSSDSMSSLSLESSSSSSSESSSSSSSSSKSSEVQSVEQELLKLDLFKGDDILEDMLTSQEFLKVYRRLHSNKRLKSFVDKSRLPKGETTEAEGQKVAVSGAPDGGTDGEKPPKEKEEEEDDEDDTSIEEEGPIADGADDKAEKAKGSLTSEERVPDGDDKEVLRAYLEGLFLPSGDRKESGGAESQRMEEHDAIEKESIRARSAREKASPEGSTPSGKDEFPAPSAADENAEAKVDQQSKSIVGGLVKKETILTEEHKSIHNMIMAIIKQSDKGAKEVSRHANMKKNYEFNWEKQKKLQKKKEEEEEEEEDREEL